MRFQRPGRFTSRAEAEFGSTDWIEISCSMVVNALTTAESPLGRLSEVFSELEEQRVWERYPEDKPWGSIEVMCIQAFQVPWSQLRHLVSQDAQQHRAETEHLRQLAAEGKTERQIAAITGVPRRTVRDRLGGPGRPRPERPPRVELYANTDPAVAAERIRQRLGAVFADLLKQEL